MSSNLNKVMLIGNVGAEPEVRRSGNDNAIANVRMATTDKWTDKNTGEITEKTEWHRITLFGRVAEVVEKYVKKGDRLYIEGRLETRKWTDKEGVEKYSTEIVVSGFDGKLIMLSGPPKGRSVGGGKKTDREAAADLDLNDEIPF